MHLKAAACAILAALMTVATAAWANNDGDNYWAQLTWKEAHTQALVAYVQYCKSKGGKPSPLTPEERKKWSDWLAGRNAVWAATRERGDWIFGGVRCTRGKEDVVGLVWAYELNFGIREGVLQLQYTHEDKPATFFTKAKAGE